MPETADSQKPKRKQPKGGSRKGRPNKTTAAVKDAILHAFDEVGGTKYLVMVAQSDPRTFCALLAKILPTEIKADVSEDLAQAIAEARERAKGT